MILQLTWAGFDAAVDVIAAQCQWRERAGLHGVDAGGQLLALVLAERLGLNVLPKPGPAVIELHGVATRRRPGTMTAPDAEVWAWVDATPDHRVQSVVKATAGTKVLMPWQDAAAACRRVFIPGLDD